MTKADLVGKMAQNAGITKAAAEQALSGALDAIGQALQSGDKVSVVGFGTFSVAQREARSEPGDREEDPDTSKEGGQV